VVSAALLAFDFQNLLAWWHGRVVSPGDGWTSNVTVVVPLYGHPRYFDGRDAIAPCSSRPPAAKVASVTDLFPIQSS
jgi:hypothetical protein